MTFKRIFNLASLVFVYFVTSNINSVNAITFEDYENSLDGSKEVKIKGISQGDGEELDAILYKPDGDGPYPALVALHGAGGIFPYQLWWAQEISKKGYVVLFVDHYCTRDHLCEYETDDTDRNRGDIMRRWEDVSLRQRMFDAVAAYGWLSNKPYVKKSKIGAIGWSWGGLVALFNQKMGERMSLPNGGFKATIVFYPNLKWVIGTNHWPRSGEIQHPTLILYGEADILESEESYNQLLSEDHPAEIKVIGFDGGFKKFDELGEYREKYHPKSGYFPKGFQQNAFDQSVQEINNFLLKNLK